jgi:hypothetical protein
LRQAGAGARGNHAGPRRGDDFILLHGAMASRSSAFRSRPCSHAVRCLAVILAMA